MLQRYLDQVRMRRPRVHCITNYITANDCANILLACGASPIMADDPAEAEEIVTHCQGLELNMGTLSESHIRAMLLAGKKANQLGIPVVLDPVGVGASRFRRDAAKKLLDELQIAVIRGNLSEMRALATDRLNQGGIDAQSGDRITGNNLSEIAAFARSFAADTGAVIAITGETDVVADSRQAWAIFNGHPMMSRVTGTGCQLSALTAAFAAANTENLLEAVVTAVCAMGVCGERAGERLAPTEGTMTYRNYLIDAVSLLDGQSLETDAKCRIL